MNRASKPAGEPGTGTRAGRPGAAQRVLNPDEPDPLLRYEYERGSNYEIDTRLSVALAALVPEAELTTPDHRFFQLVHLITEYSWVGMHHEIRRAVAALDVDDFFLAAEVIDRAVGLAAVPIQVVRLMVRHLPQFTLLTMRSAFPPNTTGLDSPGARNLRRACLALWRAFERALRRHDLTLPRLTTAAGLEGADHPTPDRRGLAAVRTGLHRLDLAVQEWKQVHLKLVWTELGGHPWAGGSPEDSAEAGPEPARAMPTSLRGRPISDVERMAATSLFPPLWADADDTYQAMTGDDHNGLS